MSTITHVKLAGGLRFSYDTVERTLYVLEEPKTPEEEIILQVLEELLERKEMER